MNAGLPIPEIGLPPDALQAAFDRLQAKLVPLWKSIERLSRDEQTIVVVPSLTVEFELRGSEVQAYEERFLFLLLLLRQPSAHVVYITSQAILPGIVDYYLGLLPGVVQSHARRRLHLVTPQDASGTPLSIKLLQRPRLIEHIRSLIVDPDRAHLVPFNTTPYEQQLALRLGIPMFGADPRLLSYGTKSGCRKLFREAGISFPFGVEDLASTADLVDAVAEVRAQRPDIAEVMVKLNEGVSGEGNALLPIGDVDATDRAAIEARVREMRLEAKSMTIDAYLERLAREGGIVEERVTGDAIRSPSAQARVTPLGVVELLSTHDQLLAGPSGGVFVGSVFPADEAYAIAITEQTRQIGERLAAAGVLGRFAVDYVVTHDSGGWTPYAIEINLRKGGTTHPFLTLQFLTDGTYDAERALFTTASGHNKCFIASDKVESPRYRAFCPDDIFDIAVRHGLHFDQTREIGVVFHMLTALGDRGRMGMTAIAGDRTTARRLYDDTIAVLDAEAAEALRPRPLPTVESGA